MGQAKRRRQQHQAAKAARTLPFAADQRTIRELGDDGLTDLATHLWAKDCQTCGWQLGTDPPSLLVQDLMLFLSASLHHQRCRAPAWTDSIVFASAPLLSYDVMAFEAPFQGSGENPKVFRRPFFFVNPHLEQVSLSRTAAGWRVNTVEHWQRVGLHLPGPDFVVDRPVPDISANIADGELSITIDDTSEHWSLTVNDGFQQAIRKLGGVTLAVSTAAVPSQMNPDQFPHLMRAGQVAMGWISLAGTTPPLTPSPAPENLRTFVLHWGPHRADVGELLTSTTENLTGDDAQAWALTHLPSDHQTLAPWETDDDEPGAWIGFHALQATHYYLRRTETGWELVKGIARRPSDMGNLQDWATRAVRVRSGNRIIDWVSHPTISPDYITFHGSAVPR